MMNDESRQTVGSGSSFIVHRSSFSFYRPSRGRQWAVGRRACIIQLSSAAAAHERGFTSKVVRVQETQALRLALPPTGGPAHAGRPGHRGRPVSAGAGTDKTDLQG